MATVPYGGDEVTSVVLDIGTSTVRAGFGGEDVPKAIFPTLVGVVRTREQGATVESTPRQMDLEEDKGQEGAAAPPAMATTTTTAAAAAAVRFHMGTRGLMFRRDFMECESPFNRDALYDNFEYLERLVDHALTARLRIQPADHPVLFSEQPHCTASHRERIAQIMFEKFRVPAFFLAKGPVLSAFAYGRSTALVVDSGASGTIVTPVYDGYVLNKGIVRNYYGGDWISEQLLQFMEQHRKIPIRAHYMFEKKRSPQTNALEVKLLDFPNTSASYREFARRLVVNDLKEATLQVSETPFDQQQFLGSNFAVSYELLDGTVVDVGSERYAIPELLFTPSSMQEREAMQQQGAPVPVQAPVQKQGDAGSLVDIRAMHLLAHESITRCDNEVKKELYNSIVLTGGNSLFHGLAKRFEGELQAKVPSNTKVRTPLAASALPVERKCSAWIGGSILASTGTFQAMWISKDEFEEQGASIVHKKCP